jgi:hypothetical protein
MPSIQAFDPMAKVYRISGNQVFSDGRLPSNTGTWSFSVWSPCRVEEWWAMVRSDRTVAFPSQEGTAVEPPSQSGNPLPTAWADSTTAFKGLVGHASPNEVGQAEFNGLSYVNFSGSVWRFIAPTGTHYLSSSGSYLGTNSGGDVSGYPKLRTWPLGCWRPFDQGSAFNTPLPPSPKLVANSAQIVQRVLGDISQINMVSNLVAGQVDYTGEPTYYAQPTDPQYVLDCTGFSGNCSIDGATIAVPAGAKPEGGSDAHINVVYGGYEYDLWQVANVPAGGGILQFGWGGKAWLGGDGTAEEEGGQVGHGSASHFAGLAGRVREEELEAGRINHALNVVINCGASHPDPNDPAKLIPDYVYPARAGDRMCSTVGLSDANAPPMGARLHLNLSEADINALPISAWKKTLLVAMANYGMFFGDTGSSYLFGIEAESSVQYTSLGAADRWETFAQANGWDQFDPDGTGPKPIVRVGKLYGEDLDPTKPDPLGDPGHWIERVWSKLEVIDPCVSERTC